MLLSIWEPLRWQKQNEKCISEKYNNRVYYTSKTYSITWSLSVKWIEKVEKFLPESFMNLHACSNKIRNQDRTIKIDSKIQSGKKTKYICFPRYREIIWWNGTTNLFYSLNMYFKGPFSILREKIGAMSLIYIHKYIQNILAHKMSDFLLYSLQQSSITPYYYCLFFSGGSMVMMTTIAKKLPLLPRYHHQYEMFHKEKGCLYS